MPVSPHNRALYGADWKAHAHALKEAAAWTCQGSPKYPGCRAVHDQPHPVTQSRVVLTIGHRDHDPANRTPGNEAVWCQRCHLAYDHPHHLANAALTRAAKKATP